MFRCRIIKYSVRGQGPKEWRLGLGPCGKTVTALKAEVSRDTAGYLRIYQFCKKQKLPDVFMIPLAHIEGPIQFKQ
jgi:hypothetical protein